MTEANDTTRPPVRTAFAVVLGTNEIASAIGVELHRLGHGVILANDPAQPVIRRKMAFHDALFDDEVVLDGITATRADTGHDIREGFARRAGVLVTNLGLLDLIVLARIDLLVDARMNKYEVTPDLRRLAGLSIGIGPGFCGGANCDLAIETLPGKEGRVVQFGATDAPDGIVRSLGTKRAERFVKAQTAARWHSAMEIGARVFKDFLIGHLGAEPVRAPFDGVVRGVVRDGTHVPAGARLLEMDPRGRNAVVAGIDARARAIARGTAAAIAFRAGDLVLADARAEISS